MGVIRNVGTKSEQYSPVETFYLTDGMSVVGGSEIVVHVGYVADFLEGVRHEMATVVGDRVDWRTARKNLMVQELFPDICIGDAAEWNSSNQLLEAFCDHL